MLCLVVGGVLVIFASLGLVLAIPDMSAVLSGKDTNPIATTLETSYGSGAGRTLLVALVIGFTSSMIAVQTAVTRAIWASARDRVLPGARLLGRLSGRENLPRYAIGLTFVVAGALLFAGTSKVFTLLVSFSAFGFYLSYCVAGRGAGLQAAGAASRPPATRGVRGRSARSPTWPSSGSPPRSSTSPGPGRCSATGTSTGASSS